MLVIITGPNCCKPVYLFSAGVPAFLASVPVLGSALRGVVIRSAQRMIQDIETILSQVNDSTDIHDAQEAEKQAHASRKKAQAQQAAEEKKANVGGRFL